MNSLCLLDSLRELVADRALIDQEIAEHVDAARNAGDSWGVIGEALGVSRQAAQQRYGQG